MQDESKAMPISSQKTALITGGAGFFGSILTQHLLEKGYRCVVIDLFPVTFTHPELYAVQGDIRNAELVSSLFSRFYFHEIYHCAAILAHAVKDKNFLWTSNVEGTKTIASIAAKSGAVSLVFTSSNCLWARNMGRPVREDDQPEPLEIYGKSKWEGEKILAQYSDKMHIVTLRCPTIIDEGRLGLLAILFEFISEGRKIWAVGGGNNRYQFIYAPDLVRACIQAAQVGISTTLNVGSDDVPTIREAYQYVIDRAQTGSRVISVAKRPAIIALKLAHLLRLSPLGPYQYRMIAEDFVFDTSRIKERIGWQPTLTNGEMLWRAYRYYQENKHEIAGRAGVSAHRQQAAMGILKLLKFIS